MPLCAIAEAIYGVSTRFRVVATGAVVYCPATNAGITMPEQPPIGGAMTAGVIYFSETDHVQPSLYGSSSRQMGDGTGISEGLRIANLHKAAAPEKPRSSQRCALQHQEASRMQQLVHLPQKTHLLRVVVKHSCAPDKLKKIGRASCRERV